MDRVQKLAVSWKKVLRKPLEHFKSVGKLFLAAMPEPTKTSTRPSSAPDQNSTFEPADSGPGGGEADFADDGKFSSNCVADYLKWSSAPLKRQ